MAEERLQKVMAAAGVGSRRACEQMILDGHVQVNGHTVTELGTKVDPEVVQIAVNGKPIHLPKRHTYLKLHKPRGVLSDIGGETRGRRSVADLLPAELRRVFPVGRLDLNSEGLILLTDDGEMAHRLTHPRFEHPKTYYVLVGERPTVAALEQLREGVELPEGRTAPARVQIVPSLPRDLVLAAGPTSGMWMEIILREGKKRQIRHMTAAVGFPTLRLVRWAIGPLTMGALRPGENAHLTRAEVAALRGIMQESASPRKSRLAATSKPSQGAGRRQPRSKNRSNQKSQRNK